MEKKLVALAHPYLAPFLRDMLGAKYQIVELASPISEAGSCSARAVIVDGSRPFDTNVLQVLPNLALIACFNAGYDGIDVDWTREHGIIVTHAPDINHEDVADFAIAQILNIYRSISTGDRWVRSGAWRSGRKMITRSVAGLRLGIVGLGSIGRAIAHRADVLRMVTSWWGPHDKPGTPWPKAASILGLAQASDVLVVAAPARNDNRGLISASVLQALGPQGAIINVARGSLVDEGALIDALTHGALGAAALDVYQDEPALPGHWADIPNLFLSPHIAGVTDVALSRMGALVRANLDAFFDGEPVLTPVKAAA
ncbi:2-hydroxyacid dehydrogenase [Mesorhizobium sp. YC-39]|uniref:2-hydroxyacid dehydrogenase n=1 Tax=unclassified Mesorhizobium TaxID=325217 RepID=UPI0021E6ED5A|nr:MULTISPECIES: 2-hydroxyacid dehydrogenase [unclassified Mesorhizobium]MCV3209351.1 2-hydroxyacid dehydrogenase [Mesorhizobium sp. YC-2]MCV3231299.1 2-hydroxyacid dehydrogenase [Mesorhizobium sp. YC-39]